MGDSAELRVWLVAEADVEVALPSNELWVLLVDRVIE